MDQLFAQGVEFAHSFEFVKSHHVGMTSALWITMLIAWGLTGASARPFVPSPFFAYLIAGLVSSTLTALVGYPEIARQNALHLALPIFVLPLLFGLCAAFETNEGPLEKQLEQIRTEKARTDHST